MNLGNYMPIGQWSHSISINNIYIIIYIYDKISPLIYGKLSSISHQTLIFSPVCIAVVSGSSW